MQQKKYFNPKFSAASVKVAHSEVNEFCSIAPKILNKYIFAETQNLIQRLFRYISPLTLKIMKKYENIRNRTQ